MNTLTITGEIIAMGAETFVTQKSGAKFPKREIVVFQRGERKDMEFPIQFTGFHSSLVEGFKVGEMVHVSVDILSRKWIDGNAEFKHAIRAEGWRRAPQERVNCNGAKRNLL